MGLKKCFCTNLFFQYLLFFQSQSCFLESTEAIFRQSSGYVFYLFDLFFCLNGFPNPFIVHSRSSFCLVNENSVNCRSGLVLLFFISFTGFLLRPYGVAIIASNLFFFMRSFNFNRVACLTSLSAFSDDCFLFLH